jgi:dihydroneopterin aldolase
VSAIIIKGLEVETRVGVSDEERNQSQRLQVDAILMPVRGFSALADDIDLTVDYQAAIRQIVRVATERPRKLIETLASEIAEMLVQEFRVQRAEVEIRKFILPDTEYVAVRCVRDRQPG